MNYLAYGSNLHPLRLVLRVPGARLLGTTRLEQYRITFHKRGTDGSAKCNLNFTEDPNHAVYVAIYDIPDNEVHLLDTAEGLGEGYYKQQLSISLENETINAFVYLASASHLVADLEPYHWYKGFVLAGIRKHLFPTDYLNEIEAVASKHDPVDSRRLEMENLLVQLEG